MKNAFCKFCGQLSANEYPEDISEAELIERRVALKQKREIE